MSINQTTHYSTLAANKDKRRDEPLSATSATNYASNVASEPVAIVLPHHIADLKRPTFLSNARIDITALEPSIVQLPDVRIIIDKGDTVDPAKSPAGTTQRTKVAELPWQATPVPLTDVPSLANKYLMLSKFRLTCQYHECDPYNEQCHNHTFPVRKSHSPRGRHLDGRLRNGAGPL